MKTKTIYKNLDTAFVNLAAFVRFLQRQNFVGRLRLTMADYEAEIAFDEFRQLRVHEFDRASGRVSSGEDAFQRLLVRSRQAGGNITVDQFIAAEQEIIAPTAKSPLPDKSVAAHYSNGNGHKSVSIETRLNEILPPAKASQMPILPSQPRMAVNNSGSKPNNDWDEIKFIAGEILQAVEKSIFIFRLDLPAVIREAQIEFADDYPFLDPSQGKFIYAEGKLKFTAQPPVNIFVVGFNACLRRSVEKIQARPNTLSLRPALAANLTEVIRANRAAIEKFGFLPPLERLIHSLN